MGECWKFVKIIPIVATASINLIRICRQELGDAGGLEARPITFFCNDSQSLSRHISAQYCILARAKGLLRNSNLSMV
jgi:hypothetical protein